MGLGALVFGAKGMFTFACPSSPLPLASVDVWVQFYQIRPIVRAIHRLSSIDLHWAQTRYGTEDFPDGFQISAGPPFCTGPAGAQGEQSWLTLADVLRDMSYRFPVGFRFHDSCYSVIPAFAGVTNCAFFDLKNAKPIGKQ